LKELGLTLPGPPNPAGNYVPSQVSGNLLFVSGQFPIKNGRLLYTGQLGAG
jgi:enamine deaminase RidA (YjgF/YER057c/UK114 family)